MWGSAPEKGDGYLTFAHLRGIVNLAVEQPRG
jgi:hypothetical protein